MKKQHLPKSRPVSMRIEAGATQAIHVDADSYLQVGRGAVMLHEAPLWSTDPLQPAPQRLSGDQGHHARHAGWLYLKAIVPTELVLHAPAKVDRRWDRLAAMPAEALRGWWGGAARRLHRP